MLKSDDAAAAQDEAQVFVGPVRGDDASLLASREHTPPRPHHMHIQANGLPKIKHFVVMLMENRGMDHMFGCMAGEGVIGLEGINGSHSIPIDPANGSKGVVNVTCGTANYGAAPAVRMPL